MRDLVADPSTVIHTVGYEKSDLPSYLDRLTEAGIDVLVDVRDRPQSRKPGFSKKKLQEAVEAVGMRYLHVQQLGDPKTGRDAARSGNHDLFLRIFNAHMALPETLEAVENLADQTSGLRICLTCFERDHRCCHRSIVAEHLSRLTGASVHHIEV